MSKRANLVKIAQKEGALNLEGNEAMAGEPIEKYLSVFREAMNKNGGNDMYSNVEVGYSWCCAFVYYCCLESEYTFPPKPVEDFRWTLAAVPAWYNWATLEKNSFYYTKENIENGTMPGDIVLFDRIMSENELDHIGIVLESTDTVLTTAEGGYFNRSGIFERKIDERVRGYIRIPESN